MGIEFKDDRFYIGLWNAQAPEGFELMGFMGSEVMMSAHRALADNGIVSTWTIDLRFRFKKDDKVFESEDVKIWKTAAVTETEAGIIQRVEAMLLSSRTKNLEFIEILGNGRKALDVLRKVKSRYVNVKIEKATK